MPDRRIARGRQLRRHAREKADRQVDLAAQQHRSRIARHQGHHAHAHVRRLAFDRAHQRRQPQRRGRVGHRHAEDCMGLRDVEGSRRDRRLQFRQGAPHRRPQLFGARASAACHARCESSARRPARRAAGARRSTPPAASSPTGWRRASDSARSSPRRIRAADSNRDSQSSWRGPVGPALPVKSDIHEKHNRYGATKLDISHGKPILHCNKTAFSRGKYHVQLRLRCRQPCCQ